MQYTHPIDRLMYRLRGPIIVLAALSMPVMLFSYGKMALLALDAWPGWVFGCAFAAHIIAWVGIGCLVDSLTEKRQSQGR